MSLSFNPALTKLAIANFDRTISLYDGDYNKKEKMPTRGANKANKNYMIRALAFSPDSTILSMAQSDNIIYSYKIGVNFKEKKSICSKIILDSPASCLQWPSDQLFQFFFGDNSGRVQLAKIKNHKAEVLYDTGSYCLSISLDPTNKYLISGHLDKSIFIYDVTTRRKRLLLTALTVPKALAVGKYIVYAGNDQKVYFTDLQGNNVNRFDFSSDKSVREFSGAFFNPSGDSVVLTNFACFLVFSLNSKRKTWEKKMHMKIDNYYSISAAAWKPNGSQFVTANVCGAVDVFTVSVKKLRLNRHFEVDYISNSKIKINDSRTASSFEIESKAGAEIEHIELINIQMGNSIEKKRFVLARTARSLILGDCKTKLSSEILWEFSEEEDYNFENENLVLIKNREEISAIQLGRDEILGSIRTDFFHKKLLCGSVYPLTGATQRRLLCYLLDTQTVCILDLNSKMNVCLVEHGSMISGLQLDVTGNKLLFKDSNKEVFLFDTRTKKKSSLAKNVNFWGWVVRSDVILCQSAEKLLVWYSSEHLSNWQTLSLPGKVVRVDTTPKETRVISLHGNLESSLPLDGLLIRFNFAMKKRDFAECLSILKEDHSEGTAFHWKNLLTAAFEEKQFFVVEKCYAALGDYGKQNFFHKLNKMQRKGAPDWEIKKELAVYQKQFMVAENMLLEKDFRDKAMEMYQEIHRWEDAIRLGRETGQAAEMEKEFVDWLMSSGQQLKAAEILVKRGKTKEAVALFCEQGLPGLGAHQLIQMKLGRDSQIWNQLETQMEQKKLFWVLGEVNLYRGKRRQALNCFIKGKHFERAVGLARKEQPEILVGLHEKWGDWLRQEQQLEASINHFVEARNVKKAVQTSLEMGDWSGAIRLAEGLTGEESRLFQEDIGRRLKDKGHFSLAEKQLVRAGLCKEAIEMWLEAERFEEAQRVCKSSKISREDTEQLFCTKAESLAEAGQLSKGEKIYLSLDLSDKAIRMYKNKCKWGKMLKLFAEFRPENLGEAHVLIGKRMINQKEYSEAEDHFLKGGEWKLAVKMYETINRVNECLRLLAEYGTPEDTVSKLHQYEEIEGVKGLETLLRKAHMNDVLIDFLCSKDKFSEAFEVAENARHKLEETHIKYAEFLARQQNFSKAENQFGKINRWEAAVQMYLRYGKFKDALRIASKVSPESIKAVHFKQGEWFLTQANFKEMENCFVEAGQADRAVTVYLEEGLLEEAARVAKKFCRSRVKEVLEKMEIVKQNMNGQEMLKHGRLLEDNRSYSKAVDVYLALGKEHFDQEEVLVQIWEKAVQLAFSHDKQRYISVVQLVARKLETIHRFDLAGYYYENVGRIGQAVENFLKAMDIERAQAAAEREPNPRERERLIQEIRESYRTQLESRQDPELLLRNEQLESGVQALVRKGDWERALLVSKEKDEALFIKVMQQMLTKFLNPNSLDQCLNLILVSKCEFHSSLLPFFRKLLETVLALLSPDKFAKTKSVLQQFLFNKYANKMDNNVRAEFDKYYLIIHLLNLREFYQTKGRKDMAAKVSFSLLRYSDTIPCDRVFYQAGEALRKSGDEKMAFLVLNSYLDMYEAIEDQNNLDDLDEENLGLLDIPLLSELSLPTSNLISKEEKNEIRDWLLSISAKFGTELCPTKKRCEHCGSHVSERCLSCPKCHGLLGQMCILTGEVIKEGAIRECPQCQKSSLIDNHRRYKLLTLNCPWCEHIFDS